MKDRIYLECDRSSVIGLKKREPAPARGIFIVALDVLLPDSVFDKQPIPVVIVDIKPQQMAAVNVTIDGELETVHSADIVALKQQTALECLADLFKAARASNDSAIHATADTVLARLIAGGVEVRIESEPADGSES